jgi:hypothetical protein
VPFSKRMTEILRLLAYIDQQIAEVKTQLEARSFDDDMELMVELLAGLQGTRRHLERSLQRIGTRRN